MEQRAAIFDHSGDSELHIFSTGNAEIDRRLGEGLPRKSLTLIEGENDTGKSVITQQIIWGAIKAGLSVDVYNSENTAANFISQMESMNLDISDYFAWGYLRLFSLHASCLLQGEEEMKALLQRIIGHIQRSSSEVVVIDSLTLLTEFASNNDILNFLKSCKILVDQGKTILIILHSYAFEEETLIRLRAVCDAHLMMKNALIGDRYVMIMEVVKMRGAKMTPGNVVSFEVLPEYGIKVIPISMAKV